MKNSNSGNWTLKRAQEFYNIPVWGEGYFAINEQGNVVAKPNKKTSIDLVKVSQEVRARDLSLPVLVRFPQILKARVEELDNAFLLASNKIEKHLSHIPYYPIKVNQQRSVIENILASDVEDIGLEVGSKTELLVALGLLDVNRGKLICNGYKDRAYIRIALYAQLLGVEVFIVIESLSELEIIKQESTAINVTPKLGMRIRMNSIAGGNWQNSGGRDAKFGLNARDILLCLCQLKDWGCIDWLLLLHFHMGSQISKLEDFKTGLCEAMQVYQQIISRGFKLAYVDVGGGLAVDYAAKKDNSFFSKSYSIQDYADAVVSTINDFCEDSKLTLPTVFTENGRATTAHHAMLITNVLEIESHHSAEQMIDDGVDGYDQEFFEQGNKLFQYVSKNKHIEQQQINEFEELLNTKFLSGEVGLEQRAWAEIILRHCRSALENEGIASCDVDKYYCNFSIFQSMPDIWGLDQIFPITPLTKLTHQPSNKARLHDLTCDSDGQISQYSMDGELKDHLILHELNQDHKDYLIGFFLLGAYQEVLGDIHNLFGDTHAINVEQNEQDQLVISELEIGDCAKEMLNHIHLDAQQIVDRCQQRIGQIDTSEVPTGEIIDEINNALFGYTYLDSIDRPAHRIKR